jgi:hypothetical protein
MTQSDLIQRQLVACHSSSNTMLKRYYALLSLSLSLCLSLSLPLPLSHSPSPSIHLLHSASLYAALFIPRNPASTFLYTTIDSPFAKVERVRPGSRPRYSSPERNTSLISTPGDFPAYLPDCSCVFTTSSGQMVSQARLAHTAPVRKGPCIMSRCISSRGVAEAMMNGGVCVCCGHDSGRCEVYVSWP